LPFFYGSRKRPVIVEVEDSVYVMLAGSAKSTVSANVTLAFPSDTVE
jgi:hypothetical protein